MAEKYAIELSVPQEAVSDSVTIIIKNTGKKTLGGEGKSVSISLTLPVKNLPSNLTNNMEFANERLDLPGQSLTLSGGSGSWQVMTHPSSDNKEVMQIDLLNDQGSVNGELAKGESLTLTLPLAPQPLAAHVELTYSAKSRHFKRGKWKSTDLASGTAQIAIAASGQPPGTAVPSPPAITFDPNTDNPLALKPGSEVTLSWQVGQGAESGVLLGPLPGGNQLSLGDEQAHDRSAYSLINDSITVLVSTSQTYVLEVTYPDRLAVTKMISLDVFSAEEHGQINLVPATVLPHGAVQANWSAWGVTGGRIEVIYEAGTPLDFGRDLQLEMGADPTFARGDGQVNFFAPTDGVTKVKLDLPLGSNIPPLEAPLEIRQWDDWNLQFQDTTGSILAETVDPLTNTPTALVYGSRRLFLCVDGALFWTPREMATDRLPNQTIFQQVTIEPGEMWLDVTTHKTMGLVALRKVGEHGGVELLRLQVGKNDQLTPVGGALNSLPAAFRGLENGRLVSLGERIYVIGAPRGPFGNMPIPVSYEDIDGTESPLREPLLLAACPGQLAVIDDALYVLRLDQGELIRYLPAKRKLVDGIPAGGTLAPPMLAAAGQAKPQVKAGLLVAVQGVLLILGDKESKAQLDYGDDGFVEGPQDWVYSPQKDHWTHCGHGRNFAKGTAVYLPDRKRLFVAGGDVEGANRGHTFLAPRRERHLFSSDNARNVRPKPLEQRYLDKHVPAGVSGIGLESVGIPGPLAFSSMDIPRPLAFSPLDRGSMTLLYPSTRLPEGNLYFPERTGAEGDLENIMPHDVDFTSIDDLFLTADGRRLFLSLPDDGGIGSINPLTREALDSFGLLDELGEFRLTGTADGRYLFAYSKDLEEQRAIVAIIDTSSGEIHKEFVRNNPRDLLVDQSGQRAYISELLTDEDFSGGMRGLIEVIDGPNKKNTGTHIYTEMSPTGNHWPTLFAFNSDESELYVADETGAFVSVLDAGLSSYLGYVHPDGDRVHAMTRHAYGHKLYICHENEDRHYISTIDTTGRQLVGEPLPLDLDNQTHVDQFELSADGRWLFVGGRKVVADNHWEPKFWVIDVEKWRHARDPIDMGTQRGMAVSPFGEWLYVAHRHWVTAVSVERLTGAPRPQIWLQLDAVPDSPEITVTPGPPPPPPKPKIVKFDVEPFVVDSGRRTQRFTVSYEIWPPPSWYRQQGLTGAHDGMNATRMALTFTSDERADIMHDRRFAEGLSESDQRKLYQARIDDDGKGQVQFEAHRNWSVPDRERPTVLINVQNRTSWDFMARWIGDYW